MDTGFDAALPGSSGSAAVECVQPVALPHLGYFRLGVLLLLLLLSSSVLLGVHALLEERRKTIV